MSKRKCGGANHAPPDRTIPIYNIYLPFFLDRAFTGPQFVCFFYSELFLDFSSPRSPGVARKKGDRTANKRLTRQHATAHELSSSLLVTFSSFCGRPSGLVRRLLRSLTRIFEQKECSIIPIHGSVYCAYIHTQYISTFDVYRLLSLCSRL